MGDVVDGLWSFALGRGVEDHHHLPLHARRLQRRTPHQLLLCLNLRLRLALDPTGGYGKTLIMSNSWEEHG